MSHLNNPDLCSIIKDISRACIKISSQLKITYDLYQSSGRVNIHGDSVNRIDDIANSIFIEEIEKGNNCRALISEELDNIYEFNNNKDYLLIIDPLDGSSNIQYNITTGSIFSVLKRQEDDLSKDFLQPGRNLIVSGYVLYGISILMIIADNHRVEEFILNDNSNFINTNKNIICPEDGNLYSANQGNYTLWSKQDQKWSYEMENSKYKYRYVGSLVADAHRTLLSGGVFNYPVDSNNINGKLRLLYECNPMAFIFEKAGGKSLSLSSYEHKRTLDIIPQNIHQKSSLFIGSKNEVDKYKKLLEYWRL